MVKKLFEKHESTLRALMSDVISEVSGQSQAGVSRRSRLIDAKDCFRLLETMKINASTADLDGYSEEDYLNIQQGFTLQRDLVERFNPILNQREGRELHLADRLEQLILAFEEREDINRRFLSGFNAFKREAQHKLRSILGSVVVPETYDSSIID